MKVQKLLFSTIENHEYFINVPVVPCCLVQKGLDCKCVSLPISQERVQHSLGRKRLSSLLLSEELVLKEKYILFSVHPFS